MHPKFQSSTTVNIFHRLIERENGREKVLTTKNNKNPMDFHSRSPLLFASCHSASGLHLFYNARKANTFELFIYFYF